MMEKERMFSMGKSKLIDVLKIEAPHAMEYEVAYDTEKDKRKFIERCKRIVRSSKEYKDYIQFLKENMDMNRCAFFPKVKHTRENKVQIEIHHEPFTLDDIVRVVISKQLEEGKPLNDLDIADEVMELHYKNMVGLVPLSTTIHEVVHSDSNKLFIPLNLCYGDYKRFYEEYQEYIKDDDILTRLEKKIKQTKELTEDSFNALIVQFQYLDVDGIELPERIAIENQEVA